MELEWVRLFLEVRGFRTCWKGETGARKSRVGFSILEFSRENQKPTSAGEKPSDTSFYLFSRDLESLQKGVVLVCGWEKWGKRPAKLKSGGDYYRLVESNLGSVEDWSSAEDVKGARLLVLPGVPIAEPWRTRMREFLRKRGIGGVLSLRSILFDLQQQLEQNPVLTEARSPAALDLLRLLRFYDLLKDPQMELFS